MRCDVSHEVRREPDLDLQSQRFGPRQFGLDALDFVVVGEFGELRRNFTATVEQAEMIDETIAFGVSPDPHTTLRDGMHFVAGFLAAFGHVPEKLFVTTLDE